MGTVRHREIRYIAQVHRASKHQGSSPSPAPEPAVLLLTVRAVSFYLPVKMYMMNTGPACSLSTCFLSLCPILWLSLGTKLPGPVEAVPSSHHASAFRSLSRSQRGLLSFPQSSSAPVLPFLLVAVLTLAVPVAHLCSEQQLPGQDSTVLPVNCRLLLSTCTEEELD